MDSILVSIKKQLGVEESYPQFDPDIIVGINTALGMLTQIGTGPSGGFSISDSSAVWSDFIGNDRADLEFIKSYVYLKTKLLFDPPLSSAAIESIKELLKELEFRISAAVDPGPESEESQNG